MDGFCYRMLAVNVQTCSVISKCVTGNTRRLSPIGIQTVTLEIRA